MTPETIDLDIAPFIDHSLLNPGAGDELVRKWCTEAERFGFASVCVYPSRVFLARECLQGKAPTVSTVIGFPSGATTSASKLYEALDAVEQGASELDVVLNLGWIKEQKTNLIYNEIAKICDESNVTVKAILETNLLTPDELELVSAIAIDAGVQCLQTCTGWNGGVQVEHIRQLKEIAKGQIAIKAAAGIRSRSDAIALIEAGATRLGTSYSLQLLQPDNEPEDPT
ncbi:deoxyribose-phosphate aldolase [Phormidium yuhuli AB48]|uniref:Deoxyribose-phosphate aldolase n=1 Tax=Phormidium yuhuli AB48 TaxID=2940671 RepID=A0ABY5ATM9_9CYAN|nr:deoxyribose-phosphate aldolase [Phormidium yuhuli]USR92580.1 deoxyribose-phosphate aldolase [Phormidium yuhuli AB48]